MRIRNTVARALAVGMLSFFGLCVARAQEAPKPAGPAGPGGPPGGGEHRRFDPEQMRQHFMEHIKEALQVGDKEWGAMQPAIEEVFSLAREAGGGGMFFGRRGRGEGRPEAQPDSDVAKAAAELRATLDNKAATPEEIKAKVTALRDAREKAKKELATSRAALREMLTPRQEAELVLMGLLD